MSTSLITECPACKFVVGGVRLCSLLIPDMDVCFLSAMIDSSSEFALLPLHIVIGSESDDDLTMENTRQSFVCCIRYRSSVR